MKRIGRLLALLLLLAFPLAALAAPADNACLERAGASLDALVRGRFADVEAHFSTKMAGELPAAKLDEVWQRVTAMLGVYRSHGAPQRRPVQGQLAVVAPVQFARGSLDFVTACDASDKLTGFFLLNPDVVESATPVAAHVLAHGARVEPLSVPSPAGPLRGALTLPAGKGPFPAVVLVQGSGSHDLDETVGPNKPYRDIADGLATDGIATLRYDKRTFDHAALAAANPDFTIDDEVTDDALTALRLLATQPNIDPHRVFVLGHSLGGQMAPRIAKRDPGLAGVIMLAAPARPLLTVMSEQAREVGPRQGMDRQNIETQIHANRAEQALLAKADPKHPPTGTFEGIPQSYWLSLHDYDQVAVAKSLSVPMLILQGGGDFQVSPTQDFDAWKKALAGKTNVTFRLFPGLGHLFTPAGKTDTLADYDAPAHVDPKVIADIAHWIKAQPAAQ
ncbi:MAG: alpha/beta fold hydrolase [Rhodanobacteraceae bacterium]